MPAAARARFAGCALVAALLLPGCGGGGSTTSGDGTVAGGAESTAATTTTAGGQPKPQVHGSKAEKHRPRAGSLCQSQIGSFVASMDSLRRRLAVGVTYDQYVNEVNGIRSTYKKIPVEKLQIDCLAAAGTPAEKAFNRYIEAANDWGDCVSELGCGSAQVEPVLQRRWRIASHLLSEAEDGLGTTG